MVREGEGVCCSCDGGLLEGMDISWPPATTIFIPLERPTRKGCSGVGGGSTLGRVDYDNLLRGAPLGEYGVVAAFLIEELPYAWLDAYCLMTPREVAVDRTALNGFSYVFDNYTMRVARGEAPPSPVEDRLVGAIGPSSAPPRKREASRLQGWVGPTERYFGKERDKGHFIAHTIGGLVDGVEINVFAQRRDLNRGWSIAGKRYRIMEQHCASNHGTLCFSRPFYEDETCTPAAIEYGILRHNLTWWIEEFDNRLPKG
jgi:hypothetical protein